MNTNDEYEILVIEDDDGFTTTWPWPANVSILHGHLFVDLCQRQHDALKEHR